MIETPEALPVPAAPVEQPNCRRSPEEVIREALETIESGYNSEYEWDLVRGMYNRLIGKQKLSNREIELLLMMDPVVTRYSQLDHRGVELNPARLSELRAQLESRSVISRSKRDNTDNNQKQSINKSDKKRSE
jgi:hypothetical protein